MEQNNTFTKDEENLHHIIEDQKFNTKNAYEILKFEIKDHLVSVGFAADSQNVEKYRNEESLNRTRSIFASYSAKMLQVIKDAKKLGK